MQEYLNKIMLSYGTSPEAARRATGCLLSLLWRRAEERDHIALHHALRGLTRLLKEAAAPLQDTGSGAPEVVQAREILAADGLTPARVEQALRMFGAFVRQRLPEELAARLFDGLADLTPGPR